MRQFLEYFRMAAKNIVENKVRSGLTMLGIIIGIAAVIMVLTIGGGGEQAINNELDVINTGSVTIMLNSSKAGRSDRITDGDIEAILKNIPSVSAITPVYSMNGTARGLKKDLAVQITSGREDILKTQPLTIVKGENWTEQDYLNARNVCVIDEKGAKELFGSTDVLGMMLEIKIGSRYSLFEIVGLSESSTAFSFNQEVTVSASVPLSSLAAISDNVGSSHFRIEMQSSVEGQGTIAAQLAVDLVCKRHGGTPAENYVIFDMAMFTNQINTVIGMFTSIISVVAGISLLVGGIGVMNIMLVSVTERTREIGIRKALGAKTRSILLQFLIEAGTLTFFGGIIGVILGILGGNLICQIAGIEGYITATAVVGIVIFATTIGLFFGIYPANKASNLSPIEALRQE